MAANPEKLSKLSPAELDARQAEAAQSAASLALARKLAENPSGLTPEVLEPLEAEALVALNELLEAQEAAARKFRKEVLLPARNRKLRARQLAARYKLKPGDMDDLQKIAAAASSAQRAGIVVKPGVAEASGVAVGAAQA